MHYGGVAYERPISRLIDILLANAGWASIDEFTTGEDRAEPLYCVRFLAGNLWDDASRGAGITLKHQSVGVSHVPSVSKQAPGRSGFIADLGLA